MDYLKMKNLEKNGLKYVAHSKIGHQVMYAAVILKVMPFKETLNMSCLTCQ